MDRRQHERYEISGHATVMTLRDVEIEAATARAVTVLAVSPSALGAEASMRVTGPRGREVVIRVRATACVPAPGVSPRRYRVTYHVVGQERA